MKRFLTATLVAAAFPALVWGAKVKVWNHHAPAHYEKAEFKAVVLTNEGALRLTRQVKPLPGIDAAHVWAVAEDKAGNLFVATGNEGKLFKIATDGAVSVAYQSEDTQILSLVAAPDGSLYAGTGPSGLIIRVPPQGEAKVHFQSKEGYIWSLAMDAKNETLYAATGPNGRIYQIDREGKGNVFYQTKQDHVLCVALASDGQLYAGTSNRGLVYRIDSKGKAFVLLDAPQTEVRTLLVAQDAVYAGTSSPVGRRTPGSGPVSSGDGSASRVSTLGASTEDRTPVSTENKDKDKDKEKPGTSSPSSANPNSTAPTTPPPSAKENSIYRIASDGTVREVFREKVMIQGLLPLGDRLLVATAGDGQLFELRVTERERSEVARLDHTQIHCVFQRNDGSVVLGSGDPGKLYVLQDRYVNQGMVVSEVLDAKALSRWGALRWKAETPPGTALSIAVRSGNVSEPDETWSDWSDEQTQSEEAMAKAPPARFLQYRLTLTSSSPQATPMLRSLTLRYQTANVAPEIGAIDVPDLDAVTLDNPKKLKLKWTATDVNEDELTYTLYYRKDGWKNWVELESGLEKREYEWDTTTTPAGVYQLKVVASDRRDNPDEEALAAERLSGPFVIDHVPPTVTVKVVGFDGERAIVEASGADGLTRLVSAAYSVDSRKWLNVFPAEGLLDRKAVSFRFKTEALKPGTHVLVLRVTDAAGNTGSQDVVFEVTRNE